MGKRGRGWRGNKRWKQFQNTQVRDTVNSEHHSARQKAALEKEDQKSASRDCASAIYVWHLLSRPEIVPAKEIFDFFARFGQTSKAVYVNNNKACRVEFVSADTVKTILQKTSQTREGKRRLDTPHSRIGFQGFVLVDEVRNAGGTGSPTKVYNRSQGRHVGIHGTTAGLGVYCMPDAGDSPADSSGKLLFYQEFQERGMTLNFNFVKRCLQWGNKNRMYELRFKHILEHMCVVRDDQTNAFGLLIRLKNVTPLVFKPRVSFLRELQHVLSHVCPSLSYYRDDEDDDSVEGGIYMFTDDQKEWEERWERCSDQSPKKSMQRCNSVMIKLSDTQAFLGDYSLMHRLMNFGLLPTREEPGGPALPFVLQANVVDSKIDTVVSLLQRELQGIDRRIGHAARAAFDACVLSPWTLGNEEGLTEFFQLLRCNSAQWVEETLWMLQGAGRPLGGNVLEQVRDLLEGEGQEQGQDLQTKSDNPDADQQIPTSRHEEPQHLMQLPRVLVTPTRTLVLPLEVEVSNRMVRHLLEKTNCFHEHDFLRVAFGEEDGGRFIRGDSSSKVLYERIEQTALDGIDINGRRYEFLGYSSSQLKELGMWFVHFGQPPCTWSVEKVWAWIGELDQIRLPSKFAARMGQAFSTTVSTASLELSPKLAVKARRMASSAASGAVTGPGSARFLIDVEDDIERCGKVFTDGSGRISREHLDACLQQVPFSTDIAADVGIVQIRIGGAKGTLALDPSLPRKEADGTVVHCVLRKSMVKFQAQMGSVEVVSIGKQIPYFLNQSVIALLETHGVSSAVFLKEDTSAVLSPSFGLQLQSRFLQRLDGLMQSPTRAMLELPAVMDGGHFLFPTLAAMLQVRLEPRHEPFMFSCLAALRSHHVQRLRRKANIFVDQGVVLMGAPSGLVPEGSVFLQVRLDAARSAAVPHSQHATSVVTGPVLVAKHPVNHPGDVRMLTAVDIPELRALRNVLLFSTHGQRPEADKLSGSDYDGDLFSVTWNADLFLPRGSSEPMNYTASPAADPLDRVEPRHLVEHFVKYARNDNLGRICNAIIAIGDSSAQHQNDPRCLELAQLASVAVDFAKSGVAADLNDRRHLNVSKYPHFMEKKKKQTYHSTKALGMLFDQIRSFEGSLKQANLSAPAAVDRWIDGKDIEALLRGVFDPRVQDALVEAFGLPADSTLEAALDASALLEEMWWTAMQNREEYERAVKEVMNKYRVHCEGELLTGCVRKFHRLHKRRRHDLAEQLKHQVRSVCGAARRAFLTASAELTLRRLDGGAGAGGEGAEGRSSAEWAGMTQRELEDWGGAEARLARRRLAACCYLCTYHPLRADSADGEGDMLLFSFPWVSAAQDLCSLFLRDPFSTPA